MKSLIHITALFIITLLTIVSTGCNRNASQWQSYSGNKRVEHKVDSVLSLMTLEEKIGQMAQYSMDWDITGPVVPNNFKEYIDKGLVGSIFNAYTVDGVRKVQQQIMEHSRLKIPAIFGYDVIHGYKTIFPIPLAESCSWDLDGMRETAHIGAEEASASGINWTFAPMVDISRDARWGRVMEGAGEDPFLGSAIAKARVEGFQGSDDGSKLAENNTLLACAKHFAAYGAAEAGRDYNTAELSQNTLMNMYMPPYKAANDAKVGTYMASFNDINGMPSTCNKWLMTNVLRDDWHFKGFVVTDYTGIEELINHGVAANLQEAAIRSVNAGIDMDMTSAAFSKELESAVKEGSVSEKTIDNAVRHILEMKFLLGLFDDPYKYLDTTREKETLMKPEFLKTARESGDKSIVLLKNNNQFFPIDPNKKLTVALIGPMVMDKIDQNGEWAAKGDRSQSISLYEGLAERYKNTNVKFIYAKGCELSGSDKSQFSQAVKTAKQADIVLAAMGENFNWSGEAASRSDIRLPKIQRSLLKALKTTGKPLGLILMNGRPLQLSWEDQNLDAIMEAWFLGTMAGRSMADVISGDYNPSARLTMSFPRTVGQEPLYYNQKSTGRPVPQGQWRNRIEPNPDTFKGVDYKSMYLDVPNSALYPFGYGLSYTTFNISNITLDKTEMTKNDSIIATVNVTNTGKRDGEIVVQMYLHDVVADVTRPVKELKGFKKIALKAGESKLVSFTIKNDLLKYYNYQLNYGSDPGQFTVFIGQNSEDNKNMTSFTLN